MKAGSCPPFVETSVVVRYLVGEPAEQAERAKQIIEGEGSLVLGELVMAESLYVLIRVYGVDRAQAVEAMAALVQRRNVVPLHLPKPALLEALDLCRPSGRVSIADALLWAQARDAGARTVYTFDRRFPDQDLRVSG